MDAMIEKTLILIKPDGVERGLIGEITARFEKAGFKIIGMKMVRLDDVLLKKHYGKYADKPFFGNLSKFMSSAPVIAMVLSGIKAVSAVRFIVGSTKGYEADVGTIRGDFSLSMQANLVHASDPAEDPEAEINRFFNPEELFDYKKIDFEFIYSEDERDVL